MSYTDGTYVPDDKDIGNMFLRVLGLKGTKDKERDEQIFGFGIPHAVNEAGNAINNFGNNLGQWVNMIIVGGAVVVYLIFKK
jgi:hypothetical protein